MTALFDPGLQPERTALAWQRTALSTAAAATVLARVAQLRGDDIALGVALVAGALAAWCWVSARLRYTRVTSSLRKHGDLSQAPLGPTAALTCAAESLVSLGSLHLILASGG